MSMRMCLIVGLLVFVSATAASAAPPSTGAAAPPPPIKWADKSNQPLPVIRQDGDTVGDPFAIHELPYHHADNTGDYNDDYAEDCIATEGAPDVVYRFTVDSMPPDAIGITISLCGSAFDTGLYVYDAGLLMIACNDDFCGLSSQLGLLVETGGTYYIIVDGVGSESGDYVIDVNWNLPCVLACPADAQNEGEPPLVDEYVDVHNGGCNSLPDLPFQAIWGAGEDSGLPVGTSILCGMGGWYLYELGNFRDTDWYTLTIGASGSIEITADAEYPTLLFELGPLDCASANIVQQATVGPCAEASMTISGDPGASTWFWVGSAAFESPDGTREYDYTVWFDGLSSVPTTPTTLSTVKALFR